MSIRGSDASRPPSRSNNKSALSHRSSTPYSSHTMSNHESLSSQSRTSKRDSQGLALAELLRPLITVKPQFALSTTSERPFVLKPLMLLSRECLPLSSLDLSTPNGEFPTGPGRFFESHIRILDLEGRLRQAPSVLLARSDATRNIYALERHQNGLYVVCKLGAWVSIEKLSHLAEACYVSRCRPVPATETTETDAPSITPQLHKESKRKRMAIEELQSMIQKRARTMSVAPAESQTAQNRLSVQPQNAVPEPPLAINFEQAPLDATSDPPIPPDSQSGPLDQGADLQLSAEDIFQSVRSHYFEFLYNSRGSLAFFAKGPLSRARSAFYYDCEANLDMNDLLDFLKSLVVTVSQIDKKYKETVPKLIDEMKVLVETSEEEDLKTKRRRPKKMKLGKDGLWTGEVAQVKKWWRVNKPEVRDEDDSPTNPQELKYHISCLRTRETQLQMIILLEILALEAVRPAQDTEDSQLPGMPAESRSGEKSGESLQKKKNKHDSSLLVNLHADRMSIWQSTTLDDMKMIAAETEAKSGQGPRKSERANSDPLKDFCIDIIVPFFAGRLPELCADLNKKLGGPVAASPPKPKKSTASFAVKVPAIPGSAAHRPIANNIPKSLEKVFQSDQQKRKASRRPIDTLARMRSATPAAIPGLKREGSEPPGLDRMRHGDRPLKERSRNILSRSVSSCDAVEMKAQKRAKVEAELKEAISALKKPNRQLAGKSIAEEAERRAGSSSSPHPRKPKNPVRNAAAASRVQVKATPANFRFRDAISADNRSYGSFNHPPPRSAFDTIPSSSSVIPATAPRNGFRDELRNDLAAFHIASTPDKVMATPVPARASMTQFTKPPANNDFIPPSSPIMLRKTANATRDYLTVSEEIDVGPSSPILPRIFQTPVKKRAHIPATVTEQDITSTPPEPQFRHVLFATPAKKALTSVPAVAPVDAAPAETSHCNTTNSQPSTLLYQQLVWEDDYDNLIS